MFTKTLCIKKNIVNIINNIYVNRNFGPGFGSMPCVVRSGLWSCICADYIWNPSDINWWYGFFLFCSLYYCSPITALWIIDVFLSNNTTLSKDFHYDSAIFVLS